MTVTALRRDHERPTTITAAQALIAEIAAENARDFDNKLAALERLAETMAGADSCQSVGRRMICRELAMRLRGARLNLEALEGRR